MYQVLNYLRIGIAALGVATLFLCLLMVMVGSLDKYDGLIVCDLFVLPLLAAHAIAEAARPTKDGPPPA